MGIDVTQLKPKQIENIIIEIKLPPFEDIDDNVFPLYSLEIAEKITKSAMENMRDLLNQKNKP